MSIRLPSHMMIVDQLVVCDVEMLPQGCYQTNSNQSLQGQPYQTTFAFQRKAESLGVRFFEHTRAGQVRKEGRDWQVDTGTLRFAAPSLLNAAGAWAGDLAAMLGELAPVEAIAPMMIVTGRLPHFCDAVVGATGRPLSFKQMPNGTVVMGGGRRGRADKSTNLSEINFPELMLTAQTAIGIFPAMRDATIIRSWSGVEGRMPDDIPVIGPSARHEGLYHAFGFSAHGFQLGPGVGDIMGNLIATGASNAPLQPFSIARFSHAPQS